MVQYLIESESSAEAVNRFFEKHRAALFDQVRGVRLDFRNDKRADALCALIAVNRDIPLDAAPIEIRALLSARLVVFLAGLASKTSGMHYVRNRRPNEEEIVSLVFRRHLKGARLPQKWDGLPYEPPPLRPGHANHQWELT